MENDADDSARQMENDADDSARNNDICVVIPYFVGVFLISNWLNITRDEKVDCLFRKCTCTFGTVI